ncbi:hypothetical protein P9112_007855 [Eukaryota sp. TZLM1-RC]
MNLTTGEQTNVCNRDCKIYNANDANEVDLLRAIAATHSGKHVIEEILDEYNTAQKPFCTVRWCGGDTTEKILHYISYSKACQRFNKKPNKRKRKSIESVNRSSGSTCASAKGLSAKEAEEQLYIVVIKKGEKVV